MNRHHADRSTRGPRRAVFLDRDGVLNKAIVRDGKPYPPATMDEFEVLPGVKAALQALHGAGFVLIVVTNQPDVARGTQKREVIDAMHALLMQTLPIDDIKTCYGTNSETCECYKPRPGMLLQAAKQYDINLSQSIMIGDRWRDIGAGKAAGTFTMFIDHKYAEALRDTPDVTLTSLAEAADYILSNLLENT